MESQRNYMKAYRLKNREKIKIYKENWDKQNKERVLAYQRESYWKHRDKRLADQHEYKRQHHEEILAYKQKYQELNKEYLKTYNKEYSLNVKRKILGHYSNSTLTCAHCGFSDIRALSIDHINGQGNKHVKALGIGRGAAFYSWLIKNNYPVGFQVLCMNCQWIKREVNGEVGRQ